MYLVLKTFVVIHAECGLHRKSKHIEGVHPIFETNQLKLGICQGLVVGISISQIGISTINMLLTASLLVTHVEYNCLDAVFMDMHPFQTILVL
jgi:hypothetical protein